MTDDVNNDKYYQDTDDARQAAKADQAECTYKALQKVAAGIEDRRAARGFYMPEDTVDLLAAIRALNYHVN